jgi:hypothetical protein
MTVSHHPFTRTRRHARFRSLHNKKYAIVLLSVSLLAVLRSFIAVPIGTTGFNIGTTEYCLEAKTKTANAPALFQPFIHDSLKFSWSRHGHS